MKRRIFLFILTLCLCLTFYSTAYAQESFSLPGDDFTVPTGEASAHDGEAPDLTKVYEAMIALENQEPYREGTTWNNDEPYSDSELYYWNGGKIDGKVIGAAGCVAFAFILSDEAFGSLPNRMYTDGFIFDDIKAGDILRMNNNVHTVIVLSVNDAGVVVAEGNYNGKVHWGRTIEKDVVMRDISQYITRYPENYDAPDDPSDDTVIEEKNFGTELTWSLTKKGTLTISGNGAMPDFSSVEEQPWKQYNGQIQKVSIEEGVTGIGSCAFWNCGAYSVMVPESVEVIGNSAFRESSLISVTIPSGVRNI